MKTTSRHGQPETGSSTSMITSTEDLDEKSDVKQFGGGERHDPITRTAPREISDNIEEVGPYTTAITLPVEPVQRIANVIATEDYSVFTVRQKRMMIATASFASWIR
jgi:hypothetical protein